MDDPDYAIYKREQWDNSLKYLNRYLYDLKPVNKTAKNHEIEKLIKHQSGYHDDKVYREDYDALINTPIKNEQIYAKDPHYLMFKKEPWKTINGINLFKPVNKEAEEYEDEYGIDIWKTKNYLAFY